MGIKVKEQVVSPLQAAGMINKAMAESREYALDMVEKFGVSKKVTPAIVEKKFTPGFYDGEGQFVWIG